MTRRRDIERGLSDTRNLYFLLLRTTAFRGTTTLRSGRFAIWQSNARSPAHLARKVAATISACLLYHKPADSSENLFSASFCQNLQTWTNIETGAECILTGLPTARKENDAGSRLKLPGIWPGHRPNFCGSQQGPEELPQWVGSGDCDALPKTPPRRRFDAMPKRHSRRRQAFAGSKGFSFAGSGVAKSSLFGHAAGLEFTYGLSPSESRWPRPMFGSGSPRRKARAGGMEEAVL